MSIAHCHAYMCRCVLISHFDQQKKLQHMNKHALRRAGLSSVPCGPYFLFFSYTSQVMGVSLAPWTDTKKAYNQGSQQSIKLGPENTQTALQPQFVQHELCTMFTNC
jgi:hypothetical protein